MIPRNKPNSGFTMVEVVVTLFVISALSIFATMGILSSMDSFKLNSASAKLMTDLRYAQHLARTRNAWYGVRIRANPINQYNVYLTDGTTDTNVADPANPAQTLVVNLYTSYKGVAVTSVNIAGGDKVEFNPIGVPYDDKNGSAIAAAGAIVISLAGSTKTIAIQPNTGRVELQ